MLGGRCRCAPAARSPVRPSRANDRAVAGGAGATVGRRRARRGAGARAGARRSGRAVLVRRACRRRVARGIGRAATAVRAGGRDRNYPHCEEGPTSHLVPFRGSDRPSRSPNLSEARRARPSSAREYCSYVRGDRPAVGRPPAGTSSRAHEPDTPCDSHVAHRGRRRAGAPPAAQCWCWCCRRRTRSAVGGCELPQVRELHLAPRQRVDDEHAGVARDRCPSALASHSPRSSRARAPAALRCRATRRRSGRLRTPSTATVRVAASSPRSAPGSSWPARRRRCRRRGRSPATTAEDRTPHRHAGDERDAERDRRRDRRDEDVAVLRRATARARARRAARPRRRPGASPA